MSGPLQAIAARWRTGGTWGAIHSAAFRLGFAIDPARVALWALSLRPRFTIVQIGAFVGDTDYGLLDQRQDTLAIRRG